MLSPVVFTLYGPLGACSSSSSSSAYCCCCWTGDWYPLLLPPPAGLPLFCRWNSTCDCECEILGGGATAGPRGSWYLDGAVRTERFSVDGGGAGARPVPLRLGGAAKVDGSVRVLMGRATCVGPSFFLFRWTRPLWKM